ncbi:MAG TPA: PAS domain S-box protein [Herpetosiphonaceae bacterium]|nr:PAS domain S-box protein [Herpetosiphonaceae bacterium]
MHVADDLLQGEEQFRLLFEHSPDAIFVLDPHDPDVAWRVVACNDLACRMNGYLPEELLGQSIHVLDPGEAGWIDDATFLERLRREGTLQGETLHRRRDGSLFYIEFSTSLIISGGRELILGIDRDLSERKRADEALRAAREELELRVQQRTAELAQANERLRSELAQREQVERRLAAQYAIGRVLGEANSLEEAGPRILAIIGESFGWELGHLWLVDASAEVMRCAAAWHEPTVKGAQFTAMSCELAFARGVGLVGEVWAAGQPVWHGDLLAGRSFPRLAAAARQGLHGFFAFPIRGHAETWGVMEFFSTTIRPPDEALLHTVAAIGMQIGQFSEQRRAEQALRAGEARKTAILEAALDCVITMDHHGRVVEFNPAAETTFGYRREDALGREMAELIIPPALRDNHRRGLAHYLKTGEGRVIGRRIEVPALRADGSEFPAELAITRIPGDGPPIFTGFVRDITERKRVEESAQLLATASAALSASLDYVATLGDFARLMAPHFADWCAVDLVEDDGSFRRVALAHVDPAKVELGWEIERRYGFDASLPEGAAKVLRTGQAALYPELGEALLRTVAHDDEHVRMLRATGLKEGMIMPLIARGRTLGAISFGMAESGRRFSPRDVELAEDLAQRAALAIDNARLYHDMKAAVHARDEFLSLAAHELKTPLTSLTGFAQLLGQRLKREQDVNERDRRAVTVILAQADRLARLVELLLDVARLETGQLTLEVRRLDICRLVRDVVDDIQPALHRHTVEVHCPDGPLIVEGDALRLEQALDNLLGNAIKYSPDGGAITFTVEPRDGQVVVSIRDPGIGIPDEAQARLFERFYRAGNTAGSNIGGMGMGLFVVKEIVSRHGGTVEVRSVENQGSTFTVRLPLAEG